VKRFINGIKYDGKVPNDKYLETTNDEHIYKKITMFYTLVENDIK